MINRLESLSKLGITREDFKKFLYTLSCASQFNLLRDYPNVPAKIYVVKRGQAWPGNTIFNPGNYLYVLLPDGELRIPYQSEGDIHHPQLSKRKPVVGAGVFGWSGEVVTYIDNKSGCYAPDGLSLDFVYAAFRFYKIPLAPNFKLVEFLHH